MKSILTKSLPHLIAIITFLVATNVYFLPLYQGKGLSQHDIEQFKGSVKEIADHREKYGEEPLWTNTMFGGMPAYLISVIYPGNLLTKIDQAMHLAKRPAGFIFVTLVGFYILLLTLGVNPWISIVGAFGYALSSYFFIVITAGHNAKIHAIAYVAPMLAGLFLTFRGKYIGGFALFALFLGLNLRAGHLQITYYAAFIAAAIGLSFLIEAIAKGEYIKFSKAFGVLVLAAFLAVGANFSRLYFSWESGKYSIRGATELTSNKEDRTKGLDRGYATDWSYGRAETFNLLIPNLMGGASNSDFGKDSHTYKFLVENRVPANQARSIVKQLPSYWGPQPGTSGPVYLGAIVVFLFVLGMFIIPGNLKWALLGVTILGVMLAWGNNMMWFTDLFLHYFPGYNKFRTVSMILFIAEFTVPLIGVLALKEIFQGNLAKERFLFGLKWALGIAGGLCLLFIALGGAMFGFEADIDQQLIASGYPAQMFDAIRLDREAMMRADAFRSLAFIILGAAALYLYHIKKIKFQYCIALLGVLIIADMWTVNRRYLNDDNFVPQTKVETPFVASDADRQILSDPTMYYRVFNRTVSTFNDASTSYFHKSIGGYHGAKLRRYQELINEHISKGNMAVYNMLNTRYVIDRGEKGPVVLFNNQALGNAWFVDSVSIVENADQELAALNNFNPETTAIVDKRFASNLENYISTPAELDKIDLIDYRANRLVYKYSLSAPRLAVFSEIHYPVGWKATIDGKEIEHIRVNYLLRAAILPIGEHEVTFEFKPKMHQTGFAIDLISSILILLIAAGWIGQNLYKAWTSEN